MININTEIQTIDNAVRGESVRDAIISALTKINSGIPTPGANDIGKYLQVNASGNYVLTSLDSAEVTSF